MLMGLGARVRMLLLCRGGCLPVTVRANDCMSWKIITYCSLRFVI